MYNHGCFYVIIMFLSLASKFPCLYPLQGRNEQAGAGLETRLTWLWDEFCSNLNRKPKPCAECPLCDCVIILWPRTMLRSLYNPPFSCGCEFEGWDTVDTFDHIHGLLTRQPMQFDLFLHSLHCPPVNFLIMFLHTYCNCTVTRLIGDAMVCIYSGYNNCDDRGMENWAFEV